MNASVTALCTYAIDSGKKLVFSTAGHLPEAAAQRSYSFGIERYKVADYAALARVWLSEEQAAAIDFDKVFRFAPSSTRINFRLPADGS